METQIEITESNKLIAEFMGVPSYEYRGYTMFEYGEDGDNDRTHTDLGYHERWDWLMPVVRKIVEIACCDDDESFLSDHYTSVLETIPLAIKKDSYKVVVEFIKWYNENQKG